jgi:aryl sulfotransferase
MKGFFWLASYPKSGNTWMRVALASLMNGGRAVDINHLQKIHGNAISASRRMFDLVCDVDSTDLTAAEIQRARPQAFRLLADDGDQWGVHKAHEANINTATGQALFPADATIGALYLVRDPRDVALSLASHCARSIDWTIDFMAHEDATLVAQVRSGSHQLPTPLCSWSTHVQSWTGMREYPITVVRFEDLVADPARQFVRVATALDLKVSDTDIAGAVAASSFPVLRQQEEQFGFRERPAQAERFFRQGRAGGWREHLTPDQAQRICSAHEAMMRQLGYLDEVTTQ